MPGPGGGATKPGPDSGQEATKKRSAEEEPGRSSGGGAAAAAAAAAAADGGVDGGAGGKAKPKKAKAKQKSAGSVSPEKAAKLKFGPKKPQTAYTIFSNSESAKIKAANPETAASTQAISTTT